MQLADHGHVWPPPAGRTKKKRSLKTRQQDHPLIERSQMSFARDLPGLTVLTDTAGTEHEHKHKHEHENERTQSSSLGQSQDWEVEAAGKLRHAAV